MNGWIIFHNGKRLSQYKFWGYENNGWIWTDSEKDQIIKESENWENKPTHIQKATLLENVVTLIGQEIKV